MHELRHPVGRPTAATRPLSNLHRRPPVRGPDRPGLDRRRRAQRALHLRTDVGNVLWDCTSLVTPETVEALEAYGGIDLIAISHPHFYSAMVEWSDAFGGVPILLHAADAEWIQRPSPNILHWDGSEHRLSAIAVARHGLVGIFAGQLQNAAGMQVLADLAIDDIYGFTWGLDIIGGGRAALDASIDRYLAAVGR